MTAHVEATRPPYARLKLSLADELIAAQRYVAYLAGLMARGTSGVELLVFRCEGCGRVREFDQRWAQRYCSHACQQRAYRRRLTPERLRRENDLRNTRRPPEKQKEERMKRKGYKGSRKR